MKKKYQVFVSSTYSDLIDERQSCVESILRSGNIPAGMELFSAGSETQLQIIKRWIHDSDVYMLLLGGRYGSIESNSGLSYSEIEYRYAVEINKPLFAVILSEDYLNQKVKSRGKEVIEIVNAKKYDDFRNLVLSKISRIIKNDNEIKLAVLESLLDIQSRFDLQGWIHSSEVPDVNKLLSQMEELSERNKSLEQDLQIVESRGLDKIGDFSYEELKTVLSKIKIKIPEEFSSKGKTMTRSVLDLFLTYREKFSIGMVDRINADPFDMFLVYNVFPHLRIYDLAEISKMSGAVVWSRYQTSKFGNKFIATYYLKEIRK